MATRHHQQQQQKSQRNRFKRLDIPLPKNPEQRAGYLAALRQFAKISVDQLPKTFKRNGMYLDRVPGKRKSDKYSVRAWIEYQSAPSSSWEYFRVEVSTFKDLMDLSFDNEVGEAEMTHLVRDAYAAIQTVRETTKKLPRFTRLIRTTSDITAASIRNMMSLNDKIMQRKHATYLGSQSDIDALKHALRARREALANPPEMKSELVTA